MKKKDLKFKHLIYYIIGIQQFRNPSFDKKLKLTELLFQTKQYDIAISDIKRYLGMPQIKISVKKKLSMQENKGGYIQIPRNLFGTPQALTHDYDIYINPNAFQ